jgi:hypothetical protein
MELQDAYAAMRRYFASKPEGEPAKAGNAYTCVYRGENVKENVANGVDFSGRRCAIGCLIPDALYDPKLEACGGVVNLRAEGGVIGQRVLDFLGITDENISAWSDLQNAHDRSSDEADGPTIAAQLDVAAAALGLVTPARAQELEREAAEIRASFA